MNKFLPFSFLLIAAYSMDVIYGLFDSTIDKLDWMRQAGLYNLFSNATLFSMIISTLITNKPFPKTSLTFKDSYDYIIVGSGTAGSVMANRLSQKPCVSVLLLEAGGYASVLTEIPAFASIFYGSDIDWEYITEPQKYGSFSQKENRVIWNSGKALGGSSVINAMMYVRGNRRNYDDWAAEGATGWSYKDVFPYFLKLEDNKNIEDLDPEYHRQGGPMTAERINYTPEIKIPLLLATNDLGYNELDINGKRQTGIYDIQATVRNQQRCSTAKAYLVPAGKRPNLDIVKFAFVRKIIIKNKRAIGVEFDHNNQRYTVQAKKEVIVSNGAVRTPQLLMLSGIGPRQHLRKFNITVVADLPVGKNLMDHTGAPLIYEVSNIPPLLSKLNIINTLDYIANREGPFTAPNQITIAGFLDGLNTTSFSRDFPRQALYFAEYATLNARMGYNLRDEVYQEVYSPYEFKPLYACFVALLQPKSRGEITLRSTNPYDYPKINPNYYQNPRDLRDMVEGMKICQATAAHPALQNFQARLLDTMYPACKKFARNEDRFLACIALQVIVTNWHPCGTARMGNPDDPRSVVDPQLRVIGVKGLRVINAAVMPIIPSANINIPTMMVAEKAYDMMKNDMQCSGKRKRRPHSRRKSHKWRQPS